MRNSLQTLLKFFLFLGLGTAILYFVYQNQNEGYQAQCALDGVAAEDCNLVQKVISDFKSVNPFWILMAALAYLMSNISRALRWKMLLKSLGSNTRTINAFLTVMLALFVNLGIPRLGEVLRPVTLAKYEKIPLDKVLGTIVVDRTMDVLSLLIIIGLAFLLEFNTLWGYLSENADKLALLVKLAGVGVVCLAVAFLFRKKIQQLSLYNTIMDKLKGFWEGILSIKNLEKPWLFVVYSVIIWAGYYLMFYAYMPAFAPTEHLGFLAALMVFVFGTFGILVPTPGGMGSYHFLITTALVLYGVSEGDAFSSSNISFFATHFSNILFGLIAIIFLPIINSNYHPTPLEEERSTSLRKDKVVEV